MQITQSLGIGLAALRRNKLRSLLTMLGIIIGISAVIGMVSVGGGAKLLVLAEFQRIGGANLFVVFRTRWLQREDGTWYRNRGIEQLEYEDIDAILETCPTVRSIAAEIDLMQLPISHKGEGRLLLFEGITPLYPEVHNWHVQSGRFIQQEDLDRVDSVCVVGSKIQSDLFGGANPVGQELKIGTHRFAVIGVMQEKGDGGFAQGMDERILIPFTTMEKRFIGNRNWGLEFMIKAESFEKVEQAVAEVKIALRRRHGSEKHFQFFTAKEMLKQVGNVSRILQILLGGVASIALFVGGIGIMNIMLVSVTERTREIGLRKAVGAQRRDILQQFLIEAVVLSVSGGLIGILIGGGIGLGTAWAVTTFLIKEMTWPASVSIQAALWAFCVSAIIGIFFGVYPARKASRLMPTEALRHE
ncbi:MAG: ABC transporter permease [Candidatus Poribacteria bacterium]|nr:ABC transporter permease [Candidatus Poribacteria bacterium]